MSNELKVLSFNCWGLAIVSKERQRRLKAIAEELAKTQVDIITLQEVWVQKDYQYITHQVKNQLPYATYFYSGVLGSGLAILSKYPIIATTYHRYVLNGKPLAIIHGDYYVGKGCGTALVEHPQLGQIEIFNTHLHAGYGFKYQYKAHRATQCWQLVNLLRNSAAMNRHIILSGDFNSIPTSFNYKLIRDHGLMTDSWFQLHGDPDNYKYNFSAATKDSYTQYFGFTCNSPYNTFSRHYGKEAGQLCGKRLDYIFYRPTPQLTCIDSRVVFTDFIPETEMSYSDHFGVLSIFKINAEATNGTYLIDTTIDASTSSEIIKELKLELQQSKTYSRRYLIALALFIMIQFILYIILMVVPSTLPQHLVIILINILASTVMNLVSLMIPVCLIVGFVCGNSEQRALTQFIQEISIH